MNHSWAKNRATSRRAGSRRDVTESKQAHVATCKSDVATWQRTLPNDVATWQSKLPNDVATCKSDVST